MLWVMNVSGINSYNVLNVNNKQLLCKLSQIYNIDCGRAVYPEPIHYTQVNKVQLA